MQYMALFVAPNRVQYGLGVASLTGIEPVWFEMENSLPYCVEKA